MLKSLDLRFAALLTVAYTVVAFGSYVFTQGLITANWLLVGAGILTMFVGVIFLGLSFTKP